MWEILKKVIFVILVCFSCQDCVKTKIQGFAWTLTRNPYSFILFVIIYVFVHCTPFRLFLQNSYRKDKPWVVNSDQNHNTPLSNEEDYVIFDPDNINSSSTSLSTFLQRYQREDWTPSKRKLRKTSWMWSSDEEDDVNNDLTIDIEHLTRSKLTLLSSSENELDTAKPRRVKKRKRSAKEVVAPTNVYVVKTLQSPQDHDDLEISIKNHVERPDNMDTGHTHEEEATAAKGYASTKALKYGLIAMGVGLGAYIVYKVCTKK